MVLLSVAVLGVGNMLRGDDAIGPVVVRELSNEGVDAFFFDCGTAPESFSGAVFLKKPKKIVIVDAVDMKKEPGTVEIIDISAISGILISTHKLPLSLTIKHLETSTKNIVFVGAQPKITAFGEEMTSAGKKAVMRAKELVLKEINAG